MAQVQVPAQAQGVNGGAANPQFVTTSLYVDDLDVNVNDSQLYDVFNQVAQVVPVRVCRDLTTRRSLGYGYVNYINPQDAARALDVLNFTPLNGKPITIMYSHRDPSLRKSGAGNIFIKNLDKAIDHKALHDTFSAFGNILSCKVATDSSGLSKGYGFVQFETEEAAQKAIEKLNGMLLNDKQVYVGPFLRKQERETAINKTKFNNVFVKNLSEATTEDDLKKTFGEFGTITNAVVMRDVDGKSKCFGFVNFENVDDAARAVEALNGKKSDDKAWYVGKTQKKSKREVELKLKFEQSMKEATDKFQGANLYIKNLDDSISDDKLKELFSPFGTITSCKVMRDPNGISRGSGFVAFSTPEEASRATVKIWEINEEAMDNGEGEGYKPEAAFQEDTREQLFDLSLTNSTELWLNQWPFNEVLDFNGKEISLNLHHDGCLGSFEASVGKTYDVVSSAVQEPDSTVFVSSSSKIEIVGKISRRVSLVHYPDPEELEKQETEKKSKRRFHISSGSSLVNSSYHSVTPTQSTKLRNSNLSRGATSSHSSRHKSSLSG